MKEKIMGKTVRTNDPQSKKYIKRKRVHKGDNPSQLQEKPHEKGYYPNRVWPTDSERKKDKGQKI